MQPPPDRTATRDGSAPDDLTLLRQIVDASADCIRILDLGGHLLEMNAGGRRALEIDDFGVCERTLWPSLWPEETRPALEAAVAAAREGKTGRFEGFCPTLRGTPRWWEVTVSPLRGAEGRVERLLAVSRDITRHRQIVLTELAAMVVNELEFRRTRRDLEREVAVRERALRDLTENRAHAETLAVLLASLEVDLLPIEAARLTAGHVARQSGLGWVALATVEGGRASGWVSARTVWHAPEVQGALLHVSRQGLPLAGSLTGRALVRGVPLFVDDLRGGPLADLGVRAAALPLGRVGDVAHVYLAARLHGSPWSAADRQLLEAAASSVRVALERAERGAPSLPG